MNTKEIIEQIHNEFNTASNLALAEAKTIISKCDMEKVKLLERQGFISTKEVIQGKKSIVSNDLAVLIEHYQIRYPLQKFITKNQVESICKKYRLICGPIDKYTGFVPKKNLLELSEFSVYSSDVTILVKPKYSSPLQDSQGIKELHRQNPSGLIPISEVNSGGLLKKYGGGSWLYIY